MREVTPISTYKYRLFGVEYTVRPTDYTGLLADQPTDEIYISASPKPDVDAALRAPSHISPLTLALVAGHHLLCVRGLPLTETTVDVQGRAVTLRATCDGRLGAPIRVRYPLSRRTDVIYSAELHSLVYPSLLGNILLVRCECSEHFEESALMSIYGANCTDVAGCVAFSCVDGGITARAYSPIFRPERSVPELAELLYSYALAELRLCGTPFCITFADVNAFVTALDGSTLVCADR